MTDARSGDTVRIHYSGTLSDGSTFDSSQGREPLQFTVGSGEIIPGLDRAIEGMSVGETKTVTVPAADAYGDHNPDGVQSVPRAEVPDHIPLDPGTQLQVQTGDGRTLPVTVTEVTADAITLDANHPLAGKDLTFEVELVEIV
ncbi:MAG: peptidylprolyl isomerase [Rhodobacteraceae bacterium]|jgi:peptidylprolyl isomerase|nr:peptidylprolyl isomerase [Paracoccaceae bacterium]